MDSSLQKLLNIMPPPQTGLGGTNVNWTLAESALGIRYPSSFKEFLSEYGNCRWLDYFFPIYPNTRSEESLQQFVDWATKLLPDELGENLVDSDEEPVEFSLSFEEGGLLPFMRDYGGGTCCWEINSTDSSEWVVHYCSEGMAFNLGRLTIASLLLGYFQRDKKILDLWGDVNDRDPSDLHVRPFDNV